MDHKAETGVAPASDADQEAGTTAAPATSGAGGFRQRKSRGHLRKRAADEDAVAAEAPDEDGTLVVRKAKQGRTDPLSFSTKKDGPEDIVFKYESNKALQSGTDNSAFRSLETETEVDRDARALREQVLRQAAAGGAGPSDAAPAAAPAAAAPVYKGMNSYTDYRAGFRREHTIGAEKGSGAHGPLRASMHIRTTARFDYQPDICKDYKETGFCSYGDACKFLHDRGDYKSGWELERDWDAEQKRKAEALAKGWGADADSDKEENENEEDDDLPFACYICRKPWTECSSDPVVTRCKHYFCESCALKRNAKTPKCAACEQPTQGIFNIATDILRKKKRMQEKEAAAAAGGS